MIFKFKELPRVSKITIIGSLTIAIFMTSFMVRGFIVIAENVEEYSTESEIDLIQDSINNVSGITKGLARDFHDILNHTVGWGLAKNREIEKFTSNLEYVFRPGRYAKLKNTLAVIKRDVEKSVTNENVKNVILKDLNNIEPLIDLGHDKKDVKAVVIAHRLAHDLDYYLFNRSLDRPNEYYGITHTLDNSNYVDEFLKERQ